MADVFLNGPSGKWCVRRGTLPMHLGGTAVGYPATVGLLLDEAGNVKLFSTRLEAERAAGHVN